MIDNAQKGKVRVVFYGTPEFASVCLENLLDDPEQRYEIVAVVTQPDRPAGRGKKITASAVKEVGLARGLKVLQPGKLKVEKSEFCAALQALGEIDIGVVVAFGQIIPLEILQIPRAGTVNVHASLLPRWRGAAPIQRAILAGDSRSGVCLMQMEAGLDTGPVLARETVELVHAQTGETLNAGQLHDLLAATGARLLLSNLEQCARGMLVAEPQAEDGVTYAQKITTEDQVINWRESPEQTLRRIKALSPFPGAFTFLDHQRLKIYGAKVTYDWGDRFNSPGEVLAVDSRCIFVSCGDETAGSTRGALELLEVQIEGKKRMPTAEFLRGMPVTVGTRFSSIPAEL